MRVGIISPNVALNVGDHNKMFEEPDYPWPLGSLAKKVSLLFDKIYLTHDLDLTCEIIEGVSGEFENDPKSGTIRYLILQGIARMSTQKGFFEFLVTGAADLAEHVVKLRFSKIGQLASVIRNRKVKLLGEEAEAPGREIALITEIRKRF
jgi:hypothetical protein